MHNGFRLTGITWWQHVAPDANQPRFGFGGPQSHYYCGWFSELCLADDEFISESVDEIMRSVEDKHIVYADGQEIRFQDDEWLTPALWIDVPDDWKACSPAPVGVIKRPG